MARVNWTRDELMLALELYFLGPNAHGIATEAQVLEHRLQQR